MILLLKSSQKTNSSLMLHHDAYGIYLTLSYHVGLLSPHILTRRRVSTGQEDILRDHIHKTLITV